VPSCRAPPAHGRCVRAGHSALGGRAPSLVPLLLPARTRNRAAAVCRNRAADERPRAPPRGCAHALHRRPCSRVPSDEHLAQLAAGVRITTQQQVGPGSPGARSPRSRRRPWTAERRARCGAAARGGQRGHRRDAPLHCGAVEASPPYSRARRRGEARRGKEGGGWFGAAGNAASRAYQLGSGLPRPARTGRAAGPRGVAAGRGGPGPGSARRAHAAHRAARRPQPADPAHVRGPRVRGAGAHALGDRRPGDRRSRAGRGPPAPRYYFFYSPPAMPVGL